jgi:hypothetical protein
MQQIAHLKLYPIAPEDGGKTEMLLARLGWELLYPTAIVLNL